MLGLGTTSCELVRAGQVKDQLGCCAQGGEPYSIVDEVDGGKSVSGCWNLPLTPERLAAEKEKYDREHGIRGFLNAPLWFAGPPTWMAVAAAGALWLLLGGKR